MTEERELERYIFGPNDAVRLARNYIQEAEKNAYRSVSLGIPGVRDYFRPLSPGQVCAIIAQTSNYKSGFIQCVERHIAQQLEQEGRDDEIIVHVSVEDAVEEQIFGHLAIESGLPADEISVGRVQDWRRLDEAVVKLGTIPVYYIGDSLSKPEGYDNLYLSNMVRAIDHLRRTLRPDKDGKPRKIAALVFDYLQAFPADPELLRSPAHQQRRLQVRSDIYRVRQAARVFDAPTFVMVQAKQELAGATPPMMIPGIYDGEESSAIAQRADRVIQLWMPKMTHQLGSTVSYKNIEFKVDENMLWLKVGKQRGRLPSGRAWLCRINFDKNWIAPEGRQIDQ